VEKEIKTRIKLSKEEMEGSIKENFQLINKSQPLNSTLNNTIRMKLEIILFKIKN